MKKLTANSIKELNSPGKFHDGGGLYLVVSPGGSKSWVFRYSIGGKRRNIGLGGFDQISPSEARDRVHECRSQIKSGEDPKHAKSIARAKAVAIVSNSMTFETCAMLCIDHHKSAWKSPRQAPIWESSLRRFIFPHFGDVPVRDISRPMVAKALKPIIESVPDTARRVRNRVERVIGFAIAMEYRPEGDNPAKWKGGLDHIFPSASTGHKSSHQPSMPFADVPKFFSGLARTADVTHAALAFLILTGTRSQETRGAVWSEFDMSGKVWLIPGDRMKAGREHRIPLSDAVIEILTYRRSRARDAFVFPGRIPGRPISDMAMNMILRRLGFDYVPHGFRSSFRDWASEKTDFAGEVCEMALAHAISNKVEAAYRRGDLFEKRRELMSEWSNHCLGIFAQRNP